MKLKVTYLHEALHKWKSNIPTIKQWTELFSETCKMQHKTQKYVWIIHSNITEDVSYSFTPDFCNFFITFPPLLSCYSRKASNTPTAADRENCLLPFELTSPSWTDQQCRDENEAHAAASLRTKNTECYPVKLFSSTGLISTRKIYT